MLERNEKQALFVVVLVMLAVLPCRQVFAQMSVTGAVGGGESLFGTCTETGTVVV